ncbi:MAG: hypothetical protein DMF59_19470, partial [Acidobacteria bacterium]
PTIADLSAIRDLLLREPVVWERDISLEHGGLLPKVTMYLSLMRALVASALGRARQHDVAAWDDLHAAWNLTKSLDGHPHLVLRIVAMSMTRAINAVAWKMPLPVPEWFDEVQKRDLVRPLFETLQYEKWRTWRYQKFPVKPFAEAIDRERTFTGELAARDLLSHVSRDGVVSGDRVSELRQLPCGFILVLRRIPIGDRGKRSQAVGPRPCGRGGNLVPRPEPRRDINRRAQHDKHGQSFFHMTLESRAEDSHGERSGCTVHGELPKFAG